MKAIDEGVFGDQVKGLGGAIAERRLAQDILHRSSHALTSEEIKELRDTENDVLAWLRGLQL